MKTIVYPQKGRKLSDVVNQKTFDKLMALHEDWAQGPGVYGGLKLHSCWSETSVLGRRYQGQTACQYKKPMNVAMMLYERTKNPKWRIMINNIVSNILFLQEPDGGFRHATGEFEPTLTSTPTCPIHQCFPILALLDYAAWQYADEELKSLIKPALDRHWEFFQKVFWLTGNGGVRPFPYEAGWCGVTNQDLVAIAAMASYGKVYGDWSRYEQYGKKALGVYLSPVYYYKDIGLFERGDGKNFAERTAYNHIILPMLVRIMKETGDRSLQEVIDNVTAHLFDAAFIAPDGMTHLAWGAKTDEHDKTKVLGWIDAPINVLKYIEFFPFMEDYLLRNPDDEKQDILEKLKESFAAYTFSEGTVPGAIYTKDPIISIAGLLDNGDLMLAIAERLGDELREPAPVEPICVHRRLGECVWKQKGKLWAIEKDGKRIYGGYTPLAYGVTHGDEQPARGSFDELEECDVLEILEI